jgi:ribosomal protein S18 acetylase RimI-like enzyme
MALHCKFDKALKLTDNALGNYDEVVQEYISNRKDLVLVAVANREIIGFLMARIANNPNGYHYPKLGFIKELAVTANKRRSGAGTMLQHECINWFKKHKIRRVEVVFSINNPMALNFYNKNGFKTYLAVGCKNV